VDHASRSSKRLRRHAARCKSTSALKIIQRALDGSGWDDPDRSGM
jgi:hypothetical protein